MLYLFFKSDIFNLIIQLFKYLHPMGHFKQLCSVNCFALLELFDFGFLLR